MKRAGSASFDRALKVELLRTRAALERKTIAAHTTQLCRAIDPREKIASLIPKSSSGLVRQVSQLAFRYPFLLSSGASIVASQMRRPGRVIAVGAVSLLIWMIGKRRRNDD